MEPERQWLLVIDGGTRPVEMAPRVGHQVVRCVAPGCVPFGLTDGLTAYGTAFLAHLGQWRHPARRREKGPLPQPRWVPVPALLDAQGGKSSRRRRLVGVT